MYTKIEEQLGRLFEHTFRNEALNSKMLPDPIAYNKEINRNTSASWHVHKVQLICHQGIFMQSMGDFLGGVMPTCRQVRFALTQGNRLNRLHSRTNGLTFMLVEMVLVNK